jgi:protein required for attachment to host cells
MARAVRPTWLLVCDASRARVFACEKADKPWTLVEDLSNPTGRARNRELVEDKAGRMGPGSQPRTDPASAEEERFADRLGELLESGFDGHRYGDLVLVAPPRFLGLLRASLSAPVARRVTASVDKNLARADPRDLRNRLARKLATLRPRE